MNKGRPINFLSMDDCKFSEKDSLAKLRTIRSNCVIMMGKFPRKSEKYNKLQAKLERLDALIELK